MKARLLDRLPLLIAALFAVGALFHLAAILAPAIGNASSPGRHAVFICINAAFAAAFGLRWRWTIVPVLALSAQQIQGHGADLLRAHDEGRTDLQSLLVLLFVPVMIASAARLSRGRAREARGSDRAA